MTINNEHTINELLAEQAKESDRLQLMKERKPLDFTGINDEVGSDENNGVDLNDSSTWKLL